MSTPSSISVQTATMEQITALLDAEDAIQALPVYDSNAFSTVKGLEENMEALYNAYGNNPEIPEISAASLSDLQTRLSNLQNQINGSNATSAAILAAAQIVGAFRAAPATAV